MQKTSLRIDKTKCGLAVIDLQERLLPAIHDREAVLRNSLRLVKGVMILGVPIFATEQYPKGLGRTVPEIASSIKGFSPVEKVAFSCCGSPEFVDLLTKKGITDVILCGIESHVCVCQSALDLLDQGFGVFVVSDAVSSRSAENSRIGLERIRGSGAVLVSTEMILFELLGHAGTDQFKAILELVK